MNPIAGVNHHRQNTSFEGTSGDKRGRPKGSHDLKKITRKVALRKHAVKVDGKTVRKTRLQLVVESTAGKPPPACPRSSCSWGRDFARRSDRSRTSRRQVSSSSPQKCRWNISWRTKKFETPTSPDRALLVDHKAEEFMKAARGEYGPLARPCWPSINAGVRDAPDESPVPLRASEFRGGKA